MGPNNKRTNRINKGVFGVDISHLLDNLQNVTYMSFVTPLMASIYMCPLQRKLFVTEMQEKNLFPQTKRIHFK
jgi:uncharacterized protein (DUF1810 family)